MGEGTRQFKGPKGALPINMESLSDEEVVERIRLGEIALFEILIRRYNQRLYRTTRAILGNHDEVEDVMQTAYVQAYLHLDQYAGRARFSTWLTRIAVNESLARLRERGRLVERDFMMETEQDFNAAAKTPDPEQETFRRMVGAMLESAVDALPPPYRTVFMLRDIEEMSTAETAECLSLSPEAVKVRLHRARALLRREIYARTGANSASAFQFLGERCDRMTSAVLMQIGESGQ